MSTPLLNAANPIVMADGTMAQHFRQWTQQAALSIPFVGEGSPEGLLEAPQYSLYLDSLGSTGSIQYRKMLPHIGGNRAMGWVLL